MFSREHHRRIATILRSLDRNLLGDNACYFGGGTAVALRHGEYRESVDVDFICSSVQGYRDIRQAVDETRPGWLFVEPVNIKRDVRVDQYGIRMVVAVDETPVKVEIIFEGRVQLDTPSQKDSIEGLLTLSNVDLVATKLMANADRYADDAQMSRDIIDLSFLAQVGALPGAGVTKARGAYGSSIDKAFDRAKTLLLTRRGRLTTCMSAMKIEVAEPALRASIESLTLDQ